MAIESMHRDYFQKSRVFLYPLLKIKRGASVTPIETYLSWENQYSFNDKKFICHYHLRDDLEFVQFEKQYLLGHELFFDFKQVNDKEGVYIFDFSKYEDDWNNILKGRYSKISTLNKNKIENFYGKRDSNYAYIESYMYPEKYYDMYANLINVKQSLLIEVGELCDHLDEDKETLKIDIKNLEYNVKLI